MEPPLRERLRWRNASESGVEAPATRAMARTAALFAGAGAFICLLGSFVPGEAQFDDDVLLVAAAASALLGAFLLIAFDSIPVIAFHPIVLLGTAVSTAAAYGWGTESAYGPLAYAWVPLFAFYFFSRGAALVHLALVAAAYALALVLEDPGRTRSTGGWPPWPRSSWPACSCRWSATTSPRYPPPQRRRPYRPPHRPPQPARLPERLRHRARACPARRPGAQPDRRRPRPLQARERRSRARRRRRGPHTRGAARSAAPSAASTARRAWAARSSPCSRRTATSTAPSCSPSASARLCTRRSWRATPTRRSRSASASRRSRCTASRADGAPAHRRPGSLRRQAARPQPLGHLERRGARHPRPRAAPRRRRVAGRARRAAQPRGGARRARLGERLALPPGRPLRRADRPRARPRLPRRSSACGSPASSTTWAAWPCPSNSSSRTSR